MEPFICGHCKAKTDDHPPKHNWCRPCLRAREKANPRTEQKKIKRQQDLERGFCGNHVTTPVVPGLTQCHKCTVNLKRRRAEYILAGICPNHPQSPTPVVKGKKTCRSCLWRAAENALKREYGITLEEYAWMEYSQNSCCKICNRKRPDGRALSVDHCHKTGKIRGLLCSYCNGVVGMMEIRECLPSLLKYLLP